MLFSAVLAGLLATTVSAHGGVSKYTFSGKEWIGWSPYNGGGQTTIARQYFSYDPILTTSGTNMRCNNNGQTSQLHGEIAAGSDITAHWAQWTHVEGPVTVYMAKCPGSCANFDGSGNVWFKIDQGGLLSGTLAKGRWGNTVVLETLKWTSKIPASLAPGNYLIRHEVLALHQANTPQFYPECAQLTVTGSGTASPSGEYLVSIPGVFKMDDPGIRVDIYSPAAATITTYPVPGPKVWTGGAGVSPANPNPVPNPEPTPAPQPQPTPTPQQPPAEGAGVSKYGQCGGTSWSGATRCIDSTCTRINDHYHQCL